MTDFPNLAIYGPLRLEYRGGRNWTLIAPLVCRWGDDASAPQYQLTVPDGFKTDLASIPQVFRSLVPSVGEWNRPSVLHDYLYVKQPAGWTRKQADDLFLAGLRSEGVRPSRRLIMYSGVRVGGWYPWHF